MEAKLVDATCADFDRELVRLLDADSGRVMELLASRLKPDQIATLFGKAFPLVPLEWSVERLADEVVNSVMLAYPEEGAKPPRQLKCKFAFLEHSVVVIEGLIAVGKSYMIDKLAEILGEDGLKCHLFPEPAPPKLLKLFYDHLGFKPRNPYGFSTQVFFGVIRSNTNNEAQAQAGKISTYPFDENCTHVSITDRSRVGDLVFVITNAMLESINQYEVEALLEIAMLRNTFQFDFIVYLDSTATRAERIMKTIRKRPAEMGMPRWYLEKLRLVYYVVLKALARRGSRILYAYTPDAEKVWMTANNVLDGLSACPSVNRCREIWAAGPRITWESSAEEVDRAMAIVRDGYGGIVPPPPSPPLPEAVEASQPVPVEC